MKNKPIFVDYIFKICVVMMCFASLSFGGSFNPNETTTWDTKVGENLLLPREGGYSKTWNDILTIKKEKVGRQEVNLMEQKRYVIEAQSDGDLILSFTMTREEHKGCHKYHSCNYLGFAIVDVEDFYMGDFNSGNRATYDHGVFRLEPDNIRFGQYFHEWSFKDTGGITWQKYKTVEDFYSLNRTKTITRTIKKGDRIAIFIGSQDNWTDGYKRWLWSQYAPTLYSYTFKLNFKPKPVCQKTEVIRLEKSNSFRVDNYKLTLSGKVNSVIQVTIPNNIKDKKYKLLYSLMEQQYKGQYKVVREENFIDCFQNKKEEPQNGVVDDLRTGDSVYFVINKPTIGTNEMNFGFTLLTSDDNTTPELDDIAIGNHGSTSCKKLKAVNFFTTIDGKYLNQQRYDLNTMNSRDADVTKYIIEVKTQRDGKLSIDSNNKNVRKFVISDTNNNCGTTGNSKIKQMKKTDTKYIGIEIKGKQKASITVTFDPDDKTDLQTGKDSCTPLGVNLDMQYNNDKNTLQIGKVKNGAIMNGHSWSIRSQNQDGAVSKFWVKVIPDADGELRLSGDSSIFYTLVKESDAKRNQNNCYNDNSNIRSVFVKKGEVYYASVKSIGSNQGNFNIKLISDKFVNSSINCGDDYSHKFNNTKDQETLEYKSHKVSIDKNKRRVRNIYRFQVPTYGDLSFDIVNKETADKQIGKARVLRYDYDGNTYRKLDATNTCGRDYGIKHSHINGISVPVETKMITGEGPYDQSKYEIVFIVETGSDEISGEYEYDVNVVWNPNGSTSNDTGTAGGSQDEISKDGGKYEKDIPDAIPSGVFENTRPNDYPDSKLGESLSYYDREFGLIWGGAGTFVYGDMLTTAATVFKPRRDPYSERMRSYGEYLNVKGAGFFNSNTNKIKLPYGLKGNQVKIKYARLFWQGNIWVNGAVRKKDFVKAVNGYRNMKFQIENGPIHDIDASMVNHIHAMNVKYQNQGLTMLYSASADVTKIVADFVENSSKNEFDFTGGNVKASTGQENEMARNMSSTRDNPRASISNSVLGPMGGWSLILVYEVNETKFDSDKFAEIAKPKQVSIFAGYKVMSALQDIGNSAVCNYSDGGIFDNKKYCVKSIQVAVTGFYTPNTDDYDAKITVSLGGGEFLNGNPRNGPAFVGAFDQLMINNDTSYNKNGSFKIPRNSWRKVALDFQNTLFEGLERDSKGDIKGISTNTYETTNQNNYRPVSNNGYNALTYQIGPSVKKFGINRYGINRSDYVMKPQQSSLALKFGVPAVSYSTGWGWGAMSDEALLNMIAVSVDLYMPEICYDEKIYNTEGWLKFFDKTKNFERIKNPGNVKPVTGTIIENEPLYYRVSIKNRQKDGFAIGTVVNLNLGPTNTYQKNSMAIDNKTAVDEDAFSYKDYSKKSIEKANFVYLKDDDIGAYSDMSRLKHENDVVYNGKEFLKTDSNPILKIAVGGGAGVNGGGGTLRSKEMDQVFLEFNATAGKYFKYVETSYRVGFKAVDQASGKELANFDYGLPMKRCTPKKENVNIVVLSGLQITNKNYKKQGDDSSIYTQIAGKDFGAKLIYQPDMTRIFPCLDPIEEADRIKTGKRCTIYDVDRIDAKFLKEYFKCEVKYGEIASNVCTDEQKRGKSLKNGLQKFKLEGPLYLSLVDASNKTNSENLNNAGGCNPFIDERLDLIKFRYGGAKDKLVSLNDASGKNIMFDKEQVDLKNITIDDAYKNATFMLTYYPIGLDKYEDNELTPEDLEKKLNEDTTKKDSNYAGVTLSVKQGKKGEFRICNSDDFSIRPAFLRVNKNSIKKSAFLLDNVTNELKVINSNPRVGGRFVDNEDLLDTILQPVSYNEKEIYGYYGKFENNLLTRAILRNHVQGSEFYAKLSDDQKYREKKIYLKPYISNECKDTGYIPQFYYTQKDGDEIYEQNTINLNDPNEVTKCFYEKKGNESCLPNYKNDGNKCVLNRNSLPKEQTSFYCYSPYKYHKDTGGSYTIPKDSTNAKYTKFEGNSNYYDYGNLNKLWNTDKIGINVVFGQKCLQKNGICNDITTFLPDAKGNRKLIKAINKQECSGKFSGCKSSYITTQELVKDKERIFNYYNVGDVELKVVDNSWVSESKDDVVLDRDMNCIINSSSNTPDEKGRVGCDIAIKESVKGNDQSLILRYVPARIKITTTGLENGGSSYSYNGGALSSKFTFFNRPTLVKTKDDIDVLKSIGYNMENNKAIVQDTQNLAMIKFESEAFIEGPKQNGKVVYKYGKDGTEPMRATLFDGQVKRVYEGNNYYKIPVCGFAFDIESELNFKFDCSSSEYANDERCLSNDEIKKELIQFASSSAKYKPFYDTSYEMLFPRITSVFQDCKGKNAKFDSRCFAVGEILKGSDGENESTTLVRIPLQYGINYYSDYSERSGVINTYDTRYNFFNPKSSKYTFIKEGFKGGKGEGLTAYLNFDRSEKVPMLPVWIEVGDFKFDNTNKSSVSFSMTTPRFNQDGEFVNKSGNVVKYNSNNKIGAGNQYGGVSSSDIIELHKEDYKNVKLNIEAIDLKHAKDDLKSRLEDSALFVYGALNHEGSLEKLTPISAKLSASANAATEVRFENFVYCPIENKCDYIPLVNGSGKNYVDIEDSSKANNMIFKHIAEINPDRAKAPSNGFIRNPFDVFNNNIHSFAIDYITKENRLGIQRAGEFDPKDLTAKDVKFVSEKVKMFKKTANSNAFTTKPGETYVLVKPWYVFSKNMGDVGKTYGNPSLSDDMKNHFIVRFTSISEWAGKGGVLGGNDKNVGNVAGGKELNVTSTRSQRRSNW